MMPPKIIRTFCLSLCLFAWLDSAYAQCNQKMEELNSRLGSIRDHVIASRATGARLSEQIDRDFGLIRKFQQDFMENSSLVGRFDWQLRDLYARRQSILNELQYLQQFPFDVMAQQRIQQLRIYLQDIEFAAIDVRGKLLAARNRLQGYSSSIRRIERRVAKRINEIQKLGGQSRALFTEDRNIANHITYFHTPAGRQACSAEELKSAEKKLEKAKQDLSKLQILRQQHQSLNQKNMSLNQELRSLLNQIG